MSKDKSTNNVPRYVKYEGKSQCTLKLSDYKDVDRYLTDYDFIQKNLSHILGEVLTVVDASVTGQQNKAIKDLIKGIFIKHYTELSDILHNPEAIARWTDLSDWSEEELAEITEADDDEVLGLK